MSSGLVGREGPLGALRDGLEAAIAGRGRLAIVSGEAGIGKTAVASVVAREAEARGASVTWGRAWEFADAPPYFPVWPCLRALGLAPAGDDTRDGGEAFHLWESVVASLSRVATTTPTVWILEDLHAADLGTLDLLTFLAQPLRAMRAFIVATVRSKDPRLTDRSVQRLTRMSRDGLDLRLEALSEQDIAALTGQTIGSEVPPGALRRIAELTRGNPLFVVECARAFRAAGGIEGTLGSLPGTVRQVILERVALLPEVTRQALACGAVLGREFSAASVARMDRSLPARIIDTLLPALRAGIVEETRPGHFIFSHTLVRDAIDDALGSEERASMHGRAEAALGALGDTADVLVERARHALASLPSGDVAGTLALADRAAERLEQEGAFDRAFELHARIAESSGSGLLPPASHARKLRFARVAREAGRSGTTRRLCQEVIDSAREARQAEDFARAVLLHAADLRPAVIDRSQLGLLEEAVALLGEAAPELACVVRARLSAALIPAVDPSGPVAIAHDAITRAKATGDDAVILDVMDLAGWALGESPILDVGASAAAELLERALRAGDRRRVLSAYVRLGFFHVQMGALDSFDRDVESLLTISDEIGHPRHRWAPLLFASARATMYGHFAESDRYVTEIRELAALIDDPAIGLSLAVHDLMRRRLQRRDGEQREAIARFEAALGDVWEKDLMGAMVRATCFARMGDVEGTRRELATVGTRGTVFDGDRTLGPYLAEAYAVAGTDSDRRRLRGVLARRSRKDILGDLPTMYEGTVPRLLGLLDAALGDLPGAERHLHEAYALAVERGQRPWVAQCAHELAGVLRGLGKAGEAARLQQESAVLARELGMTGLLGAAEEIRGSGSAKLEREGDVWRVERGPDVVRVRDSRGMQILARLVERCGEEVHVLALASDDPAASLAETDAGDLIDERARKAYRERLADLDEEIMRADGQGEAGRARRLRDEAEALRVELARAVGLGGRSRRGGSATERARVNVQRRVKDAIARIGEVDGGLGRFFERAVSTGTFCCFRP